MASVPAWTKDWRPLASELCGRVGGSVSTADGDDDDDSRCTAELLLLRTDRVVGKLYSHRFLDILPQDVQREVEALETKFRVHSLEDRALKLKALVPACDYQVLKLLLELAQRPTAASDEQVAVDKDSSTGWLRVIEEQRQAESREKQLQEQLAEELFEISTNNEWFQPWDDDSDGFSDWDDDVSMTSETSANSQTRAGKQAKGTQDASDWDSGLSDDEVRASLDSRVRSVFADHHPNGDTEAPGHGEDHTALSLLGSAMREETGLSDEALARDELLRRYFLDAPAGKEHKGVIDGDNDDHMLEPFGGAFEADYGSCALEEEQVVPFTMERPWLLCSTVVHDTIRSGSALSGPAPTKLIHEHTAVNMVFQALGGFDSFLFEFYTVKCSPPVFSLDFETSGVQLSRRSRGVAVGHLSPSALYRFLDEFALTASDLQLLRDLLRYLVQDSGAVGQERSVTLEGLACALSAELRSVSERISEVEQQINTPMMPPRDENSSPWSDSTGRQPTLLGIYGGLKEVMEAISWLKQVMIECFSNLATRHWREIKRAEQAKEVLSTLYRMLETEYVEHESARTRDNWPRFDVLLHLFVHALNPYLDLLNGMVFERGHMDTIPLVGELFFATPASLHVGAASPMRTERDGSFKEGLLGLAPYEVNRSLVPVFLEPVNDLLNEALASRQMKNQFLQQQQRANNEPLTAPELQGPSLRELFTTALEDMGWGHSRAVALASVRTSAALAPLHKTSMLEFMPFSRIVERCLTSHVEEKCRELSRSIAVIFRTKLRYLEHVDTLRSFVLMEQQDVFAMLSAKLIAQMRAYPVAWADSERITTFHQSAIQRMVEDGTLSSAQQQLGSRISIRIDAKQLNALSITHKIDIAAMKCLYFTFSIPQPLRVLFSSTIMQKYSRLGLLLVQVKAVESAIVKFKHNLRHRRCYRYIEQDIHSSVIRVADMLHYTKSLLNYLTNQISSADWSKYRQVLASSQSLTEMDEAHEQYLDLLLNRFFLLEKHTTVIQYILTTFSHILRFVGHVDELVKAVERNLESYFPSQLHDEGRDQFGRSMVDADEGVRLLERPEFRTQRTEMTSSSKEFKRQSHFLVVMLTAMLKHGASPHVREILTQLNYNYFYHRQEQPSRPRFQQPQSSQQQQVGSEAPRRPPPAPEKARVRNRSQYLGEI